MADISNKTINKVIDLYRTHYNDMLETSKRINIVEEALLNNQQMCFEHSELKQELDNLRRRYIEQSSKLEGIGMVRQLLSTPED